MRSQVILFMALILVGLAIGPIAADEGSPRPGYFDSPPVYVNDDVYTPLRLMGVEMPAANTTMYDLGAASVEDAGFRAGGVNAQPNLDVRLWAVRGSAIRRIGPETSLAISIPYVLTRVGGALGGRPASASLNGLGNVAFIAKQSLWSNEDEGKVFTAVAGIELPTGKDNSSFDQSNASTNGYYASGPRLPLAWQASTGTTNAYLGLAYRKMGYRHSYEGILAYKLHGKGDAGVRLGNTTYLSLNGTFAWNNNSAISMGLTWRGQQDDSYPNAPAPGVNSPALAGTTLNGSTVFFTPSIRFRVSDKVTVGALLNVPISKPKDGMVPDTRWNVIFSL